MFDVFTSANWDWLTFLLYYAIGSLVVSLCSLAAKRRNHIDNRHKDKGSWVYYISAYVVLVLLAVLRNDQVGPDTWKYVEKYQELGNEPITLDWRRMLLFYEVEPGYLFFCKLVKSISPDYHFLYFCLYSLVALAYIRFISFFIEEGLNTTFLKLFIVFYVANMSGMRSALATVPLLFSFIYLAKKNYIIAFVLTIVATLCHYTMLVNFIVILGIILMNTIKSINKRSTFIVLLFLSIIVSIGSLSEILGIFDDTKYSFYTTQYDDLTFMGSLIYVAFGIILFCFYDKLSRHSRVKTLAQLSMLFILLYPLIYITGAYRLPNYYGMPRLIVWCYILSLTLNKYKQDLSSKNSLIIASEVLVFVFMLYRFGQSAASGYFRYQI